MWYSCWGDLTTPFLYNLTFRPRFSTDLIYWILILCTVWTLKNLQTSVWYAPSSYCNIMDTHFIHCWFLIHLPLHVYFLASVKSPVKFNSNFFFILVPFSYILSLIWSVISLFLFFIPFIPFPPFTLNMPCCFLHYLLCFPWCLSPLNCYHNFNTCTTGLQAGINYGLNSIVICYCNEQPVRLCIHNAYKV